MYTYEDYLNNHGADHYEEPSPDYDEDEEKPPRWLEDWLYYLEQYEDEFCEARDAETYTSYIDRECKFESLAVGTIFLCDRGYMVKVTEKCYYHYSDDIETLDDYLALVDEWDNHWSDDTPILATDYKV